MGNVYFSFVSTALSLLTVSALVGNTTEIVLYYTRSGDYAVATYISLFVNVYFSLIVLQMRNILGRKDGPTCIIVEKTTKKKLSAYMQGDILSNSSA